MMNKRCLCLLLIVLISLITLSAVAAEDNATDVISVDEKENLILDKNVNENVLGDDKPAGTFADLQEEILNAGDVLEINRDYKFDNGTDDPDEGVVIDKNDSVINGNGHKIDGGGQSRIFFIIGVNVTIKDLTFANAKSDDGSVLYIDKNCSVTTENVVFENNSANHGIIFADAGSTYVSNDDRFINSVSTRGGGVYLQNATAIFDNTIMAESEKLSWGFIQGTMKSMICVYNSIFANSTSEYCTAINGEKYTKIKNCTFINLHANFTAGAIALKELLNGEIMDCTFVNVTSEKNGGAIFIDCSKNSTTSVNISNCRFDDCYSGFGGAIMQLEGNLTITDCNFTDNAASFDGGAIYASWVGLIISNSTFNNNAVVFEGNRGSFGGAIFSDYCNISLKDCTLANSSAMYGGAIYLYDSNYTIVNNVFNSNFNLDGDYDDIFSMFDVASNVADNSYSGPNSTSYDYKDYATTNIYPGIKLILLNSTIDVVNLPSRFDLRDWGWVTPVRNQGQMGACWAFGAASAMESAILRYLGFEIDISENNVQDMSLKFYKYGRIDASEGGVPSMAAFYALSWFGVFSSEYEAYDQLGKISPLVATNSTIHFQDVVILPPLKNPADRDLLKEAILKYGVIDVIYYSAQSAPYLNENTSAQYCNNSTKVANHGVGLVGWDDDYPASNFLITPPGDGAWIVKNSWGEDYGDDGYYYISYYDATFATREGPYAFLLTNTEEYNKNYQYDLQGELFYDNTSYEYLNVFDALDDDLIAGVGTYFNKTNVEYSVEVYVNDELKLVQNGVSPFAGFHTIQLDYFIPIKKGDQFAVKMKSNCVPLSNKSRQHYLSGVSLELVNGTWVDVTNRDRVSCLKVYTVVDDTGVINNNDITVDYDDGKYFSVKVVTANGHAVGAGEGVEFTINGKTTTVKTDDDGIAKIKITDVPGTYAMTTSYNGKTYKNTVTVKLNLKTCKVTGNKNIKVDYASGSYFSVKVVSANGKVAAKGASVKFTINGKTKTVKTNSKGIAKIKITDVPGKYTIKTIFNGKTYTNKVTVKQVLKAKKVTVKKTAKKFTLKATLKINGKKVKGKKITFKFNGKTYKVKTNKKGIAQKTFKKNVIKKLKKGKTYSVKVTYLKDTIKTTVKVK